jgi:type IV secretory pathway component VirB8
LFYDAGRKALVHALGFGVTQVEIINSLKKFNALEPYMVTFDAFTEVAAYLKAQEESKDNEDDSIGISRSQYIAAGSAADAVRSYNLRIKSGSSKNVSENASVNSSRPVEPSSPFINTN